MPEVNDFNSQIIKEFREKGGKLGGPFEGASMLLLHTTGARSGAERVNPVAYQDLGDGVLAVFGSKAGAPTNPDWYHNLVAHPEVTAEVGTETRRYTASVAAGEERERIWKKQVAAAPGFGEYEAKTGGRQIPVVILTPAG